MNAASMIRVGDARKKPWALSLARRYTRWKLRRGLDGVFAHHLERIQSLAQRTPLIFAANHVSFWDPLLIIRLDEALGSDAYVLMDRTNLRRLPFMAHLGAIPLSRNSPAAVQEDLQSAARMLNAAGRAVWIFPQGQHRPHHLRPLHIRPGVQRLAELAHVPVVPVAIAYHFRHAPQPQASIRFGVEISPQSPTLCDTLAEQLDALLMDLDAQYERGHSAGVPLVSATHRSPETGLGARLLGGRSA